MQKLQHCQRKIGSLRDNPRRCRLLANSQEGRLQTTKQSRQEGCTARDGNTEFRKPQPLEPLPVENDTRNHSSNESAIRDALPNADPTARRGGMAIVRQPLWLWFCFVRYSRQAHRDFRVRGGRVFRAEHMYSSQLSRRITTSARRRSSTREFVEILKLRGA